MTQTITVDLKFTIEEACEPNPEGHALQLIQDGMRDSTMDTEAEAVQRVRDIMDDAGLYGVEIDLDGLVQ